MADAYTSSSTWRDTGASQRSYPPHRSSSSGYESSGVGGYASDRWTDYDEDERHYRGSSFGSDNLVPVACALVGGVLGYMLPAMLSPNRSRSSQSRGYGMRGSGYGQGYGAGASSRSGMSSSGSVEIDETTDLIASNKVEGTAVYNHQGESLGEVYNFMVGKRSGRVAYAVMSFGGFLGIGQRYHALPWNVLTYDTSKGGYVINATKDRLMDAPSYAVGEEPFAEPGRMRSIREFWGDGI